uniref:Alpha-macroglobulin-like TED domain-containing protein n=1 Tax=Chrysemys picta bellii TaxID=8478 RepID=A0A8C3HL01_CHRPI
MKTELPCENEVAVLPETGQKDTVIKQLLVEVCGPLSPCSDILGTAMQNLQQLLQMPFGCGEQNMVLFAPNIYVLDYLNKTGQLIHIRARSPFTGYQRQLNYKHLDGSYSTFGEHYRQPGNTWLTAFVLKSFAQARSHIFIEEKHIQDALAWLAGKQKENGCFRSSGTLLNNAIKVTLAHIVTLQTLIISPLCSPQHSVVRSALFCLETAMEQGGSHVYTKALMAYAFTLAGKEEKHRALLDSLDKEAVKEGETCLWALLLHPGPLALCSLVEMTSYVLLAYLPIRPAPSQEDLLLAAQIATWISKQQNPNGGFSSTQDTVVALQALSRYGASTYTKSGGASTVTLQSTGNFQTQFQVDHTNRLLLQRVALPEVPGDYSTGVTGEGCVYVQTSLRYNVLPKPEEAPFALEVHTVPETCDRGLSYILLLSLGCWQLEGHHHIHRTELSTNHVLLYMEQVSGCTGPEWARKSHPQCTPNRSAQGRGSPKPQLGKTNPCIPAQCFPSALPQHRARALISPHLRVSGTAAHTLGLGRAYPTSLRA